MTGIEIGIENNSDEALKEWTLELEIDQLKSCDGWNGNFKVKGNKLTVTNVDYNGEIAKGGSTSIGCNIGTGTKLNVKSAKLNGVECTVKRARYHRIITITTIIRIMTKRSRKRTLKSF